MLKVEPDGVRDAAPKFAEAARTLAEALTEVQSALDGLGAFWGDDSQGGQFAAFHQPNRQAILGTLGRVQTGLDSIAPALHATAEGYEAVDRRVAGHLGTFLPSP